MANIDNLTDLINNLKIKSSFSDEFIDVTNFISKIKNMYLDIFNHGYILKPKEFINNYILKPQIPKIILNLKYEQREHFVNILIDELNKYKNELEKNKMQLNGGNIKHKGNLIKLSNKKLMKI
jgi:hypothetical protein